MTAPSASLTTATDGTSYGVGSTAVVTGAAGGIGRAIADRLVAQGFRVLIADIDPTVEQTASEITAQLAAGRDLPDLGPGRGDDAAPGSGAVSAFVGDCASEAGVEALVAEATRALGQVDVFFANAGVEGGHGLGSSEAAWAQALEVNVMAHVRAARLLVPTWLDRGSGRFVVTASAAGLLTMLGSAPYSVSKHGAVAFAEWLRATYSHKGIVVQAICPQGVKTRMLGDAGALQELLSHDRALEPSEVADVVWEALQGDSFLVLPHPEVAGYYAGRAADPDRWLRGMGRLQAKLDAGVSA